jgi:hypothetical protein
VVILVPYLLKLAATHQSYIVKYTFSNMKHHEFDAGAFLVSFFGFKEMALSVKCFERILLICIHVT